MYIYIYDPSAWIPNSVFVQAVYSNHPPRFAFKMFKDSAKPQFFAICC